MYLCISKWVAFFLAKSQTACSKLQLSLFKLREREINQLIFTSATMLPFNSGIKKESLDKNEPAYNESNVFRYRGIFSENDEKAKRMN